MVKNMLCEKCGKKEATVYYSENINGKEKKFNLCADCAAEMEKSGELKVAPHLIGDSPFGSLFGGLMMPGMLSGSRKAAEQKKCPLCGASFRALAAEGMVGCPMCYTAFAEELEPSLARLHQGKSHIGRAPARLKHERDRKKEIASLEHSLKEAVKAEEYEKAAELRDKIRAMKEEESK
jgi:protein arginine kinase activator